MALALIFGLIVSALLHFVFIWPRQEPPEDEPGGESGDQPGDQPEPRNAPDTP